MTKSTDYHLDLASLESWWPSSIKPHLISGPCSVETRDQFLDTARQLKQGGKTHLLRGGLWKPRTRPDSFEGVGEKGIAWMLEARMETGLPITTEVANAHHAELCLKNEFDILWIGARTTVNPFSVQEIADVLQGTDVPVIVKNPLNPDLQLWIGALERLNRAGVKKLIAMHRGFSYYGESVYRNKPMWEIPVALKTLFPDLEIFCDPSHICGRRDLLHDIAQKALDLGMSGLMLESHIQPDLAWSDARQQVTPHRLHEMMEQLLLRSVQGESESASDDLSSLRTRIDRIDEEIIQLIAHRMDVTKDIGYYKKKNNVQILQLERWREIVKTRTSWAEELGLTHEFIEKYLEQLHQESIRTQTRLMNDPRIEEGKI